MPVIFVRRTAHEKTAKETGRRMAANNSNARDRRQQLAHRSMAQNRGPHSFQRIGDRDKPRNALQPHGQHGNRIHHSSHHGGKSEDGPIHRIAALEDQQIARAQDAQSRKRQHGRRQHQQRAQPVGPAQGKAEQDRAPADINRRAQDISTNGYRLDPARITGSEVCVTSRFSSVPFCLRFLQAFVEGV